MGYRSSATRSSQGWYSLASQTSAAWHRFANAVVDWGWGWVFHYPRQLRYPCRILGEGVPILVNEFYRLYVRESARELKRG